MGNDSSAITGEGKAVRLVFAGVLLKSRVKRMSERRICAWFLAGRPPAAISIDKGSVLVMALP